MKTTNLILHIITGVLLGLDFILVAINFLMGLGYYDDGEMAMVLFMFLLFMAAPVISLAGGIILSLASKKMKPGTYMVLEILIHGMAIICFGIMIALVIVINIHHYFNQVPGLSTGYTNISPVDLAGFAIGIAGIIVTVSGVRKIRSEPVCS